MLLGLGLTNADELSLEDRIQAQKAIERIYWAHRIWPSENPGPKPSFESFISEAAIRLKVEAYLQKSEALERLWAFPITSEHLQAEMARMARETRQPELLQELFAAMGNDPFVIAECLARPVLADRLIRNRYARDERFHRALKRQAREAVLSYAGPESMKAFGGRYAEATWKVADALEEGTAPSVVTEHSLTPREWNDKQQALEGLFSSDREQSGPLRRFYITVSDQARTGLYPPRLILEMLSPLQEDNENFFTATVLESAPDHVKTATVAWPKRSFDSWWEERRSSFTADLTAPSATYNRVAPRRQDCSDDSWRAIKPGVTDARSGHAAVWTGTEMIVWGGFGANDLLPTGGRYDPATDTWTPTSTGANVPAARLGHTAVWTGREMIVWGGYDRFSKFNSGGRYDPTLDAWEPTIKDLDTPAARHAHTAVWTGTAMIVWGGTNDAVSFNTGGLYDPLTNGWTPTNTTSNAPRGRSRHTAVWTGREMIIWGGLDTDPSSGGRYDPTTDAWQPTSTLGTPSDRFNHVAVWTGAEMIVWGGRSGFTWANTGARYDPLADAWTPISPTPSVPPRAWFYTAVWTGDEMIVWGGANGIPTGGAGGGARYSPSTDSWLPTNPGPGAPFARLDHTAVWTGAEMIIWGGRGERLIPTNMGGRYSPTSDSWTPMSVGAEVPSPRWSHTAVWTGTEMIVWGGTDSGAGISLDSGGLYSPATDAWSPTSSSAGLPAARRSHAAVWTGREMIVWGRDGFTGLHVSGARYSPMTNRWKATTSIGAPTPRSQPTAVWTGTEMILWGGYDYDLRGATDTGGRFNPARNRWTPTSRGASGPRARAGHSAVWTGREMIVWGGNYTNSGDRYDPKRDTWRPTSVSSGVPAPRASHSAVWTGREMIIWGGALPSRSNTGGRYDPDTNTWIETSTGRNTPSARWLHTAVWTGHEMIIWGGIEDFRKGGIDGITSLDTGGRYSPLTDRWSPTSTGQFAPVGHMLHTAVWTGDNMIIWGGTPAPSSSASYCSAPSSAPAE